MIAVTHIKPFQLFELLFNLLTTISNPTDQKICTIPGKRNKKRESDWTTDGSSLCYGARASDGVYGMVKLTPEMKETFSKIKLFPVATASKKGVPNVAPIAFVKMVDDETLWLADNFMHKTLANVKENPHMAIYIYDSEGKKCYQIKGTVDVRTAGPDYEKMKKMVHEKKPDLPAKSLLVVKITEVFECNPGPHAGKKLL